MNTYSEMLKDCPKWVVPVANSFYYQYFKDDQSVEPQDLVSIVVTKLYNLMEKNINHYGTDEKIAQSIKYACINELIKEKNKKEAKKRNDGLSAIPLSYLTSGDEDSFNVDHLIISSNSDLFGLENLRHLIVGSLCEDEKVLFEFLWNNHFNSKKEINEAIQKKFKCNRCKAYRIVEQLQNKCLDIYQQVIKELQII